MAGAKEIRTKIKSVQNTQKITKAMEKVAFSKMRRAQERIQMARPFADKIQRMIGHIAHANPEYRHPFMLERPVKRVGMIVISTDRGLCGGLNANIFRTVLTELREYEKQGIQVDLALIGTKAQSFFRRVKSNIISTASNLGDKPALADLLGVINTMIANYRDGQIDRVVLASNQFVNMMTQSPTVTQLLPAPKGESEDLPANWDYLYEPSAPELLDGILVRYVEAQVYRGAVENVACEMAARMVAMKAATDNAGQLINQLKLTYNKARQASITKELAEIVGGAATV